MTGIGWFFWLSPIVWAILPNLVFTTSICFCFGPWIPVTTRQISKKHRPNSDLQHPTKILNIVLRNFTLSFDFYSQFMLRWHGWFYILCLKKNNNKTLIPPKSQESLWFCKKKKIRLSFLLRAKSLHDVVKKWLSFHEYTRQRLRIR